ncbi:MAG: adenylosuccinate lyase [Chloroflexi bacterium]|nr:adenylosuccinate lyase [Chloroflexota bacterium]
MKGYNHNDFLSPFTWRYGSPEMRRLWSETNKRRLWRRVWVALATAQHHAGLISTDELADLQAHQGDVDFERAQEIEAEIHHDLMAELRTFAEQCPTGGGKLHLGATSMDIEDNADALRLRQSLDLTLAGLDALLAALSEKIERYAATPCLAYTHIQPAEPTTLGYRLALYAQDLLADRQAVARARDDVRGKGLKGAVGTAASYTKLLEGTGMSAAEMEAQVMADLGLEAWPVTSQVYPRRQDWQVLSALAGVAASLHKLAFDLRLLQSPPFGEWSEPFGAKQVGSSAMPFKRNPITAEKICSLARLVRDLPAVAWDNAANSLLERTLDDSANRRVILPQAFLATDEMLRCARRIVEGLVVDEDRMAQNLATYGPFAATEPLLMALARAGADRQAMHEVIREHSLAAWQAVRRGEPNPLAASLAADERITTYLPDGDVRALMTVEGYVGDAPERAILVERRACSGERAAESVGGSCGKRLS